MIEIVPFICHIERFLRVRGGWEANAGRLSVRLRTPTAATSEQFHHLLSDQVDTVGFEHIGKILSYNSADTRL